VWEVEEGETALEEMEMEMQQCIIIVQSIIIV
jgi:hypothetical protein